MKPKGWKNDPQWVMYDRIVKRERIEQQMRRQMARFAIESIESIEAAAALKENKSLFKFN